MLRKVFGVILLSVVVALPVFAGGASEPTADSPVTIRFSYPGGDTDVEVYSARIAAFEEAHPHIRVEQEHIVSDYDQRLRLSIASGDVPDVMWMAESMFGYVQSGVLEPLDDFIASSNIDMDQRFGPTLPAIYSTGGTQYGMPDRSGAMVLFYNMDLFDAAGVDYPHDDWTWDDFIDAATRITDAGNGDFWGAAVGFDWWPWEYGKIYGHGGQVLDVNGNPVYDSAEVTAALNMYRDLFFVHEITPKPDDFADAGISSPDVFFARGVAAMNMTGGWAIQSLIDADFAWNMGTVPSQGHPSTTIFGSALAMASSTRNQEAAWEFIQWMSSVESQTIIAEMRHDVPANAEVSATVYPRAMAVEGRDIAFDVFSRATQRAYNIPLHPNWTEITSATGNGIERIILQGEPIELVQRDVQRELLDIVGR